VPLLIYGNELSIKIAPVFRQFIGQIYVQIKINAYEIPGETFRGML
jgi:hypothetical protein